MKVVLKANLYMSWVEYLLLFLTLMRMSPLSTTRSVNWQCTWVSVSL